MGNITQDNRLLSILTPLGKDVLLLQKMSASEALSELFSIDIELVQEETTASFEATEVDIHKLLGQRAIINVLHEDGTTRYFNGIINRFSQGIRNSRFSFYHATIVPDIWVLTQKIQSRIFQQISVPDILKKVINGFNVKYELQATYEQRNYCVQYHESDFDFVSRLMEEEGIYYYFEHTAESNKMIIADTPQSHRDCRPKKSKIPYFNQSDGGTYQDNSILTWRIDYQLQTGKVALWDFNFQLPKQKLDVSNESKFNDGNSHDLEIYDYPAGYARKYDGINKSGGDQSSNLQKIFPDRTKTGKILMQSIDAKYKTANGVANCCALTAGYKFGLIGHPNKKNNEQYVITAVQHEAEQSPAYVSSEQISRAYENNFSCISHSSGKTPFRPPIKTPKPIVHGNQTAFVVGPAGEEIFTDKYGRVKVQFHWDRDGQVDANSSCWLRVAQSWAGKNWGMMFIPRIGMEVVVNFLEGDPDQPIIVGCVYNSDAMPPYKLPDEKTKMAIKSDSSKGGQGFNELRFEDKKGSEQVFIHGEKDLDMRIKHDRMEFIGNDRHLVVFKDKYEKVGGDKHAEVLGDLNEKVTGTVSMNAQQDIQEIAGQNYAVDAGMAIHLKSGMNLTIETGTNLTLKVGGNFININPGGVFISGTMVMINSGGSAGSGAGSSPEAPKAPKEAAKAEFGQKIALPPKLAPPKVFKYSPSALAMKSAAKSGTPFCDI